MLARGRVVFFTPWYLEFTMEEFDARPFAPQYPLTLSLLDLPLQFVDVEFLEVLGSLFGIVVLGSTRTQEGM